MSSAPVSPGLSAAVRLAERRRRGDPARGGASRRRALPLLFRSDARPRHRQRQSSAASGNRAALDYLAAIGARGSSARPGAADIRFRRLETGERWRLRPNDGRVPWWLFDRKTAACRGTSLREYLAPLATLFAPADANASAQVMACAAPLYERLWGPLLLAGLNTEPPRRLGRARCRDVARDTRRRRAGVPAAGRRARALAGLHRSGARLSRARAARRFVSAPACVRFDVRRRARRSRSISTDGKRGARHATTRCVAGGAALDRLGELLPGLEAPDEFRAIVNAHFRIAAAAGPAGHPRRGQRH